MNDNLKNKAMKKTRLYVRHTDQTKEYRICNEETDEVIAKCYSNIAAEIIRRELENFLNK